MYTENFSTISRVYTHLYMSLAHMVRPNLDAMLARNNYKENFIDFARTPMDGNQIISDVLRK